MFSLPGFLDATTCHRIRAAMDAGVPEHAEVLLDRIERQDAVRRASSIELDAALVGEIEGRLDAQREAIAAFYRVDLGEREGSGFVRYPRGGFYRLHRDRADVPSWPGAARRTIAAVAFLNADFAGGRLRLFFEAGAVDVQPDEGLLVAFPADVLHEVTRVREGTRYAIVDWFYGSDGG